MIYDDINFDVYFIRDKKGGIEKKCETCGHTWWVSKNPEKQDQDPDCFECKYNDAWMDHLPDCHYCGIGCDGCSGPEEEWEDEDSREHVEPGIG